MLDKKIDKIVYDDEGKFVGVESEGKLAKGKQLLADPTYFIGTDKVKKVGQVARCIVLLPSPIPKTNNSPSCQMILPHDNLPGRKTGKHQL